MVPDVTMIRLWPGCVCQPVLAIAPVSVFTAGQELLCTYKSERPLVFCIESHTSPSNPAGSSFFEEWLKASISPKVPIAMVVALKPDAAVAETFPTYEMAATTIAALNKTTQISFFRILEPSVFFPLVHFASRLETREHDRT